MEDRSLQQLINVATLPGIVKAALVMPDAHEGYGFPIGGIAATRFPDGAISPGGIGYDINCGVRLLTSELVFKDVEPFLSSLAAELYKQVPSGMGKGGFLQLSLKETDDVLRRGASWGVERDYGLPQDLVYCESGGCLPLADPRDVSHKAKTRGSDQLGTIGAGNHFVEVDRVSEIFDPGLAKSFGLQKDQVVVLIHTGSRGLGHQVATDYLRIMINAMPDYGIHLPDRELTCVPWNSKEGQSYFRAMSAAANFAWCNRQIITWEIRKAWENIFGAGGSNLKVLYDIAHNIAKIEDHKVDDKMMKLIVHRKGATRAFGPGFDELPERYREAGQPVLIPGSMGTASYVLAGTSISMTESFGSSCHGAGRQLSRRAAKKQVDAPALKAELLEKGIHIEAGSYRGIAEEAPIAYKNVHAVVDTIHQSGIAIKVAELRPLAVIKG